MTSQTRPRVAIATCSLLPDLEADDAPVLGALADRGVDAHAVVWDDPAADWASFDLVVVRDTWDYTQRREEFLAWTRHVAEVSVLANPAPVVEWNTDKTYLRDLADAGLPVVPTKWLDPARGLTSRGIHSRFPSAGEFVVKPTVASGSRGAGRYRAADADDRGSAVLHAKALLAAGETVMVQPYLTAADDIGETALVYFDGVFSHAVRKGALLSSYRTVSTEPYLQEDMSARDATPEELMVGGAVLAALPAVLAARGLEHDAAVPLLLARVDLLAGRDGAPLLLELEVTEPSLFLRLGDGALDRWADAVAARVGR